MAISKSAQLLPNFIEQKFHSISWGKLIRRAPLFLLWLALAIFALIAIAASLFLIFDHTDVSRIEFYKTGMMLVLPSVLPAFILALIFRFKRLTLALSLPMLFLMSYYIPFFLPKSISVPPDAPQLTVMTYNLLQPKHHEDEVTQLILNSGADVIAVQELSTDMESFLSKSLAEMYPYQALHPQAGRNNYFRGQGVFSRYPIVEDDYWQYQDFPIYRWRWGKFFPSHGHQRVVLDLNGQEVVLYNTHIWPAIDWAGDFNFITTDLEDYGHSEAISRLVERTSQETLPLLWVGDFNMSDQYTEYDDITAYLTDSFRESGFGLGFTYPAQGVDFLPAIMRIDYVFHSDQFVSINTRTLDDSGPSDHYPVISTLALVNNDGS